MLDETRLIRNGDLIVPYIIYKCNICNSIIEKSLPMYEERENDYHLCVDCAFKQNKVDERWYLRFIGCDLSFFHAGVNPEGLIKIWTGHKTPPWERKDKDRSLRHEVNNGITLCEKCHREVHKTRG